MDNLQHAALSRQFYKGFLQPSVAEHALFIEGELAKLKVLDKHDYDSWVKHYEQRAELLKPEEVVEVVEVAEVKEDEEVVEVVEVVKKKRGRKPSPKSNEQL